MTTDFKILALDQVHESKLNPRKFYDPVKLGELAESVKAKGVITPILVRPNAAGFEIAAGHRRYRAAKLAGLAELPAIVREMDDADFVEVLNIENLQRQDMTPLEEAEGYRLLMTKAHYDVRRIAERIGKSEKYVYDRVKLLQLVPQAQTLLRENTITAGHAILLARLNPKDQARALDPDDPKALFRHEDRLWTPDEEDADEPATKKHRYAGVKAGTVRELEGWIDQHVRFDAKTTDPIVFPETAEVLDQVKEKAEKIVPITHSHYIQEEAREGRTFGPRSWKRADGSRGSKGCEHAVTGVIVVGPGRGEAFKVCIAKEKCKTHWGAEQRERTRRTARGEVGGSQKGQQSWEREQEKRRQEHARLEAEHVRWKKAAPAILGAVAAAVKKAPTRAEGLLGTIVLERQDARYGAAKDLLKLVPRGATAEDLVRHLAYLALVEEFEDWSAPDDFPKRAKAFGLDVKKILETAAPAPKPLLSSAEVKGTKKAAKK